MSKRSHKTIEIKVFLLFLLDDRRLRIRIHISDYWIRIREAQKHVDPVDPIRKTGFVIKKYGLSKRNRILLSFLFAEPIKNALSERNF
jgi:hypothetical protein